MALAPVGLASPKQAHSQKNWGTLLTREKYFQPVDQPAPSLRCKTQAAWRSASPSSRGKVVILNFIHASCGDECPLHSVVIAQLQSMIKDTPMKDRQGFISITTDPNNDVGPVLADYGASHGLDLANWTFLTSPVSEPEDTTRRRAKAFGLVFEEVDGAQMHGVVTNVIDKEGQLRGLFHGLNFAPLNLITFANALVNDVDRRHPESRPEWSLWPWFASLFSGSGLPSGGGAQ